MSELVPFGELGGLDLITHDTEASPTRARSTKNIQKRRSNGLTRRQGYKVIATNSGNSGGFGTAIYSRRSATTGLATKETLSIGRKLYKLSTHTLTVGYAGAGIAIYEVILDITTATWRFRLYEDSVSKLDFNMGVGFDEASVITITNLIAAIAAVPSFSASTTGGGSLPAAFLPFVAPTLITVSSTVVFSESVAVNQPSVADDPFLGAFTNRNSVEFENVSHQQLNDVIYFASKWDWLKKYDGADCYRAGCPQSPNPSPAASGAGGLAAGTYQYAAVIVQVDAQGNRNEGIESASVSITTGVAQNINVTLSNLLNTSGFNTDCAVVNGAQVAVTTITVDDGGAGNHTMKVGQTAYFFDSISAAYVERLITAKAATTITIAGAAVTVADNAVISNNLRIMLLRTVTTGSILRVHTELPNNSFTATQVYNDGKADAALTGADYESPGLSGFEHGLPPKCGYISTYKDGLVLSGNVALPDEWYWSGPDGPETFPSLFSDIVQSGTNISVTGLSRGDKFFWVHKGDESFFVSGNLQTGQYTSPQKGDNVGCVAHATIQSSDKMLLWLGDGAVFCSIDGGVPQRISDDIAPIFDNAGLSADRRLQFKRAVAVYERKQEIYILFIPAESTQGAEVYANSNSRTLVFDTRRGEWWEWTGLNMAGGLFLDDMDLVWTERRYSTFSSTMAFQVQKRLNTNSSADYVDHTADIPWEYMPSGWIGLGKIEVDKKFNYVHFYCSDPERSANFTLTTRVEKDFVPNIYQTILSTVFGMGGEGGWGFGAWGFFAWGNPRTNTTKVRRLRSGFSKSVRLGFSATGIYSEIALSSFSLDVTAPFRVDTNIAKGNQ